MPPMSMMRARLLVGTMVLVAGGSDAALHAQGTGPPRVEMLHIDGRKNPELIPQWNAWGYAFRVFAGGPRQLPTMVLDRVSKTEEAFILAQADLVQHVEAECRERLGRIAARRPLEKPDALARQVRELALECREATLRARDRVLAALNPDGQAALIDFVESTKAGTSITIAKSELARFREPE
jgi:hypothetical protein